MGCGMGCATLTGIPSPLGSEGADTWTRGRGMLTPALQQGLDA
jgi:hypothetical protein